MYDVNNAKELSAQLVRSAESDRHAKACVPYLMDLIPASGKAAESTGDKGLGHQTTMTEKKRRMLVDLFGETLVRQIWGDKALDGETRTEKQKVRTPGFSDAALRDPAAPYIMDLLKRSR